MPSARAAAAALVFVLAGCLGGVSPSTTPTDAAPGTPTTDPPDSHPNVTYTPFPDRTTEFPDGPKSPPERPAELANESVREFVLTYERRWVYNAMYPGSGENAEVRVRNCEVHSLESRTVGYVVVVSCRASSSSRTWPDGKNGTPVRVHGDWFSARFTYLVDEDSLIRRRSTDAETN